MQHRQIVQSSAIAWETTKHAVDVRLRRVRAMAWLICQAALAGGAAWIVAREVFGHSTPFFAAVAAVVSLGTTYGQRLRRIVEISVGVSVGIGIADLFRHVFDHGDWRIVAVVGLAMTAAVLLNGGPLLINQAAVQSIVVTTLLPLDGGLGRIEDALVGGAVALVAATIVPGAPLRKPRELAAAVVAELSRLLRAARESARDVDLEAASVTLQQSRETEGTLDALRAAAREGLEVVRTSPFRRRSGVHVRTIAELVEPLDRALRNSRVMIRRIVVSARLGETMPHDYLAILDEIAESTDVIATELAANRSPERAIRGLVAVAQATGEASEPLTLSAATVLAQMRSLVVDLLQLAGLSDEEAAATVPPRP